MADQLRVSTVNTIEHPDGDYTPAPVRGDLVLPTPALHAISLRPERHAVCFRSPDQVMIA